MTDFQRNSELYIFVFWLTFIVTLPLVTFRMLNPTVGIISSLNCPDCKTQAWTTKVCYHQGQHSFLVYKSHMKSIVDVNHF